MTTSRPEREHPQQPVYATASPWGAAAQERPGSIVVEVPEPEAERLDVLDDEAGAFGGGVGEPGAVPAQDRCLPAGDGAGEPFELGHLAAGAVVVEGHDPPPGLKGVAGKVGVAQQFLGEVGGANLAFGVAGIEPGEHAGEPGGVEAVVASEQPSTDPVERIALAAPVAQGVVLGAVANLVERGVGEADHVKWSTTTRAAGRPLAAAVA
jgi:hypothetical protein